MILSVFRFSRAAGRSLLVVPFSLLPLVSINTAQKITPLPPLEWNWRDPQITGEDLHAIASHDGSIVAVGDAGTVVLSQDGINWLLVKSPTRRNLSDVAWAGNEFLAVGQESTLLASPNGYDWEQRPWPNIHPLTQIAHGAGVTLLGSGAATNVVFRSTDNLAFETLTLPEIPASLSYARDRFFFASATNLYSSVDGRTWTQLAISAPFSGEVIWTGLHYIVPSATHLHTSLDGVNWNLQETSVIHFTHLAAQGPNLLGISSTYGKPMIGSRTRFGGYSFLEMREDQFPAAPLATHAAGELLLVAGQNGVIASSFDGVRWHTPPRLVPWPQTEPRQALFGAGTFAALATPYLLKSYDGRSWSSQVGGWIRIFSPYGIGLGADNIIYQSLGPFNEWFVAKEIGAQHHNSLHDLAFTSFGVFLGMSNGVLALEVAPNGFQVTNSLAVGNELFTGIAEIPGRLIATTGSGDIYASTNTTGWTLVAQTGLSFQRMASNGRMIVAATHDRLYSTEDGTDWLRRADFSADRLGTDVSWDNRQFLASGGSEFFESTDGTNWSARAVPYPAYVAFDGFSYMAVTRKGVLQSDPIAPGIPFQGVQMEENLFRFMFEFRPGWYYQVHTSTNLQEWRLVTEIFEANNPWSNPPRVEFFIGKDAEDQYYRVKAQPRLNL